MKQYKIVNNLCGWLAFAIAATVYLLTIEPTASFWDCPEFITTGYKLEVGHAPGAPFFMLMANAFTQLTNDPTQAARMVNSMSALMSGACILFLFWSITHLTKKLLINREEDITLAKLIVIMSSGMVGALVYTFSDTFWFSAVEGEVYATSSLFTAVVFWLILKWEDQADQPHSDQWLVLIAYLTGISIGVHLLNLLCIPAIVLVYYFKKNPNANAKGSLLALLGSFVIVGAVLYGIVPGIVKVGGWFELFFVNTLGFAFNTGLIIYIILLISLIVWGVYESYTGKHEGRMKMILIGSIASLGIPFYGHGMSSILIGLLVLALLAYYLFAKAIKEKYKPSIRVVNTTMICLMMIVIGYSSYAVIVIRSVANTPMDQNSPEDIFSLGYYLGREQYGDRPLFYGQTYASRSKYVVEGNQCRMDTEKGAPNYVRKEKASPNEKDQYMISDYKTSYKYAQNMFFPRMYDYQFATQYESWVHVEGKQVAYDNCGENIMLKIPTQLDNIKFFLTYQMNFMYWRYFMWNFSGRQNDLQGYGQPDKGNWITGFNFIDKQLVGDQNTLPDELKANRGHNVFYCLPLILGLLGLLYQAFRGEKGIQGFWVVFFLFFMTGIAIVLYLNQTPSQPRERDYAYAGSFYAYAIWIGMGVAAIYHYLRKYAGELPTAILASVAGLAVPIQMASQTWDDHDRSRRYVCRDFGQNYLYSTQPNANPVIFTFGDNDTFPLWYCQETEGTRTDMRVCNLSYLQTDWYIDQMLRPAYSSPALPSTLKRYDYASTIGDVISIDTRYKEQIKQFQKEQPQQAKQLLGENPYEYKNILKHWILNTDLDADKRCIPCDSIEIPVDKEAVRRSGMMLPSDTIPDKMIINLKGRSYLTRAELMMIDFVANANWERPIYASTTVPPDYLLCFNDYFMLEGLAKRITPFNTTKIGKRIDTERMYDNIMHKFKFGNIADPHVYLDENTLRMCNAHRRIIIQLATELLKENKKDKAKKVLDYGLKVLPENQLPFDYANSSQNMANLYYLLGDIKTANHILEALFQKSYQYANWYLNLDDNKLRVSASDCMEHMSMMNNLLQQMEAQKSVLAKKSNQQFESLYPAYVSRSHLLAN